MCSIGEFERFMYEKCRTEEVKINASQVPNTTPLFTESKSERFVEKLQTLLQQGKIKAFYKKLCAIRMYAPNERQEINPWDYLLDIAWMRENYPSSNTSFSSSQETPDTMSNQPPTKKAKQDVKPFLNDLQVFCSIVKSFFMGSRLYIGGSHKMYIWDVYSRKSPVCLFENRSKPLFLSADGRTLFSVDDDNAIEQWNMEADKLICTLTGHTDVVVSLALSADGKTLFSGAEDGTVKQWDLTEGSTTQGTCTRTLAGHTESVVALALSADGLTLFSASWDRTVKQWDLNQGTCTRTLVGHDGQVYALALSADGKTLYSGAEDETIKQWDLNQGTCTRTLAGHTDGVSALALSADGKTLYSGSDDTCVMQWNLATGKCIEIGDHYAEIDALALSNDGKTLISGDHQGIVKQWDLTSKTSTRLTKVFKMGYPVETLFLREMPMTDELPSQIELREAYDLDTRIAYHELFVEPQLREAAQELDYMHVFPKD